MTKQVEKIEVQKLFKELFHKDYSFGGRTFNLPKLGWSISFNNRKRSFGLCKFGSKRIELSLFLINNSDRNLSHWQNTILHEIAHAIDCEKRGTSDHSWRWRVIALEIGCDGKRCSNAKVDSTKSKYKMVCGNCGKETPSHKKVRRTYACGDCCNKYNGGRFHEKYALKQILN